MRVYMYARLSTIGHDREVRFPRGAAVNLLAAVRVRGVLNRPRTVMNALACRRCHSATASRHVTGRIFTLSDRLRNSLLLDLHHILSC